MTHPAPTKNVFYVGTEEKFFQNSDFYGTEKIQTIKHHMVVIIKM